MLQLYNTLTRKKDEFVPIKNKAVGLYTCGPTVYDFAHLGNLRTYIFEDILKRVLKFNGFRVRHVMNVTDVGHLVSDADEGEDKMMKALNREKLEPSVASLKKLADKYFEIFKKDISELNILEPDVWCKATGHIKEQINLIETLVQKGFAYETADGIYFNTSKLKDYGKLSGQAREELEPGARVALNPEKRNPTDFALWMKAVGKHASHLMRWPSLWGDGFPGWHIECSAMSRKYLGQPFDIHCGGIDHVSIHHTNEIAQSEAAYGTPLANFWLHGEFLTVAEGKMAKSSGTFITLEEVVKKKICPLAYRYLCLTAQYRSKLNFTWESLKAAESALVALSAESQYWKKPTKPNAEWMEKFTQAINDDLDMPRAIALLWYVVKTRDDGSKAATVLEFDKIFGLGLKGCVAKPPKIPASVKKLVRERERARESREFAQADSLRGEIEKAGFTVEDTADGAVIRIKIA
ncbi:MAG: cysteine--tRNA ligase [Patescibacteria group bacterium]|nr:cysteine--tRNA ligase [Patescibacteria group bacterium]